MAISCRNYQACTNLQSEIATTSVRTGFAMTNGGSLLCHCEERSDVAISCRNYRLHTNLFMPTVCRLRGRFGHVPALQQFVRYWFSALQEVTVPV